MKKSTKLLTSVAVVIGLSTTAFGCASYAHSQKTPDEKAERMNKKITKKLELTEAQATQLSALTEHMFELGDDVKETRKEHKELVESLLSEPKLDQDKMLEMIYKTTKMINDEAPEMVAAFANFVDSLDAEQKQELQKYLQKRMKHKRRH